MLLFTLFRFQFAISEPLLCFLNDDLNNFIIMKLPLTNSALIEKVDAFGVPEGYPVSSP